MRALELRRPAGPPARCALKAPWPRREACSQRTLQMLSGMFEKVAITSNVTLPVVPKSHDDLFLAPADENIGERPCVNGDR